MTARPQLLGVPFDVVSLAQALDRTAAAIRGKSLFQVVTPGPEFVMAARHHDRFRSILSRADLSLPDGFGLVLAARFLGLPRLARISGMDFLNVMFKRAEAEGWRFFFFGAQAGVAEQAAAKLLKRYPRLSVAGVESGWRHWLRLPDTYVCWRIRRARPDILLVALGAPQQELWIDANRQRLGSIRVAMGVGGAFDFWSGRIRRAPRALQRLGLEWLWRLLQEPRARWQRIVTAVFLFPLAMLREKWRLHV